MIVYDSGKNLVESGTGTDANGNTQPFSVSNNSSNLGEYTHILTQSQLSNISGTIEGGSSNEEFNFSGYVFSTAGVRQYGQPKIECVNKYVSIDEGYD